MPSLRGRDRAGRPDHGLPELRDACIIAGAGKIVGGCGSYACTPGGGRRWCASQPARSASSGPVLTITQTDLDNAVPLSLAGPRIRYATAGAAALSAASASPTRRFNRLAIASLVCAIAGIPLFGAITGLVAIVLAVSALVVDPRDAAARGLGSHFRACCWEWST